MLILKPRIGLIAVSAFLTVAATFGHAAIAPENAVAIWLLDEVDGGRSSTYRRTPLKAWSKAPRTRSRA